MIDADDLPKNEALVRALHVKPVSSSDDAWDELFAPS